MFVGDLVDRGPKIPQVLKLVMNAVARGAALCVPGNHDVKLMRKLRGREVQITHGLAESLAQLANEPEDFRKHVAEFIDDLVSHYVLDDGKLVVAHAGMKESMQGRGSGDEFKTDWLCLDCELMPWSAKAQELLKQQYAAVGASAQATLAAEVAALATISFLRLRAWCGIARNQTYRPLHYLKPHFLKIRTLPDSLNVAEAIVEHAALAVVLRPDDSEIFIGALHAIAREIDLVGVEAEENTNILPGEILNLINLVEECERRRKIVHSGELCIFHDERRVELAPRVTIEIAQIGRAHV